MYSLLQVVEAATYISEAETAGRFALRSALEGNTGMMAAFERVDGSDYQIAMKLVDVAKVCNQEKKFPQEWIINHGTDISEAFLDYAMPLIQGESKVPFENGLPSCPSLHLCYSKCGTSTVFAEDVASCCMRLRYVSGEHPSFF